MKVKVVNRNFNTAPRKVRYVVDTIRGKSVDDAMKILRYSPRKKVSLMLAKLISSAVAQAGDASDSTGLVVSQVSVDGGFVMKRIHPRAQGRAYRICKRTSHINLEISKR